MANSISSQVYDEKLARSQQKVAQTNDMKVQRDIVLEMLDLKPGDHVLELGSGNGIFCREMLEVVGTTGRICGIDPSEPMVAMARNTCPGAEFTVTDATALGYPDASFDAVTAMQVLSFVPDIDKALAEMFRVLKPGGRAVLLDTDWDSLDWKSSDPALMDRVRLAMMTHYANANLPRTLANRLKAAGFDVVEERSHKIINHSATPDKYVHSMFNFARNSLAENDFAVTEQQAWLDDQTRLEEQGEFRFSLTRSIFKAEKPG